MKRKYQPKRSKVQRESEPLPWKFSFVVIVSGAILVAGFLFAAKTHFSSVNFCMNNAELRKQISELEAEKRRLALSKELAMAPAEIRKAARKLGLVDITAINIATVGTPSANSTTLTPNTLVAKTVDTKPVEKPKTAVDVRDRKAERAEKNTQTALGEVRERRVSKTGK